MHMHRLRVIPKFVKVSAFLEKTRLAGKPRANKKILRMASRRHRPFCNLTCRQIFFFDLHPEICETYAISFCVSGKEKLEGKPES